MVDRWEKAVVATSTNPLTEGERLQRFELVNDTALAYQGTDELLVDVLDRLLTALGVETAGVLLADQAGTHLVTAVERGTSHTLPKGRIRIGQGFAGHVASHHRASILHDTQPEHTHDETIPRGVASVLGVPLVSQGTTIGVLQVGSSGPVTFTDDDVDLAQSAADRMALAIEARSSKAQISAAIMLQRSLLPARLPPVAGLEMAARYLPGEGGAVGGDWYDVFTLPSGHVAFAVGDVVGHGLPAAVVMGRLRSALRAYALNSLDPADVLTQLNRKLRHFEQRQMATVLYGVLEPTMDRLHISSAGHPPAMLAAPGQPATQLEVPPDFPVGVPLNAPRRSTSVELPAGTVLCVYTDGLVERRGESLDEGLVRLCEALSPGDPEELCDRIMDRLVGSWQPQDDVALLVLRPQDVDVRNSLVLPAERPSVSQVRRALRRWLAENGASEVAVGDVLVAVGEAVANVVEHAYGPAGGLIEVTSEIQHDEVVATVRDNGTWRPPRSQGRGRGMQLMEGLSDEVHVERSPTGTIVTMRRRLHEKGER